MFKKIIIPFIILIALNLAACGSNAANDPSLAMTTGETAGGTLPPLVQITIGVFKLENTAQAVTAEQAAELLPLWQVYQSMSTSDNAAQEELEALVEQLQDSMTSEQMNAISDMKLTQEDLFAVMQEQGLAPGGGQGLSAEQIATAQAGGGSGGGFTPPDGGGFGSPGGGGFAPPDGAGGFPGGTGQGTGGQNLNPEQIATARAERSAGAGGGMFNRVPPMLVEAVIKLLETKAGS